MALLDEKIYCRVILYFIVTLILVTQARAEVIYTFNSGGDSPVQCIIVGDKIYVINAESEEVDIFSSWPNIVWQKDIEIIGVSWGVYSAFHDRIFLVCQDLGNDISYVKVIDTLNEILVEGLQYTDNNNYVLEDMDLRKDFSESILYTIWYDEFSGESIIHCLSPVNLTEIAVQGSLNCEPWDCLCTDEWLFITDTRRYMEENAMGSENIYSRLLVYDIQNQTPGNQPTCEVKVGCFPYYMIMNEDKDKLYITHKAQKGDDIGITVISVPNFEIEEEIGIGGYAPHYPIRLSENVLFITSIPIIEGEGSHFVGTDLIYMNLNNNSTGIDALLYGEPIISLENMGYEHLILGCSPKTDSIHVIEPPEDIDLENPSCIIDFPFPGQCFNQLLIVFGESSIDDKSADLHVYWDFGDRNQQDYVKPNNGDPYNIVHNYNEEGAYEIKMTVYDDFGNKCEAYTNIYIEL